MDTVSERLGDVLSQCHTHAHFAAFLPVPPAPINQSINQSSPSIFVDGAFSSFSLSLRRIPTDIVRCTGEFVRFWTLQISARRSGLAPASAFPTSTMGRCGHYCMRWSTKSTPQNVSVRCSNCVSTKWYYHRNVFPSEAENDGIRRRTRQWGYYDVVADCGVVPKGEDAFWNSIRCYQKSHHDLGPRRDNFRFIKINFPKKKSTFARRNLVTSPSQGNGAQGNGAHIQMLFPIDIFMKESEPQSSAYIPKLTSSWFETRWFDGLVEFIPKQGEKFLAETSSQVPAKEMGHSTKAFSNRHIHKRKSEAQPST